MQTAAPTPLKEQGETGGRGERGGRLEEGAGERGWEWDIRCWQGGRGKRRRREGRGIEGWRGIGKAAGNGRLKIGEKGVESQG